MCIRVAHSCFNDNNEKMKRFIFRIITVLAVTLLTSTTLLSCGEDKESANQESISETPTTPIDSNQESETDGESTQMEDDSNSNSVPENNGETETSSSGESQPSADEEEVAPSFSCAAEGWNVAPKIAGDSYISGGDILTDARIGAQDGYDRFVLEFDSAGSTPESFNIGYVFDQNGGSTTNVSDDIHLGVEVQGSIALQVVVGGSHWDVPNNVKIYDGPDSFSSPLMGNIIEARFGGSHAGIILWGIGVQEANGYRILELSNPPRFVIDICAIDDSDKLAECLNAGASWTYPGWLAANYLTSFCETNF